MKRWVIFCLFFCLFSALAALPAPTPSYPNLIGTWSGLGKGLSPDSGFYDIPISMTVTERQGNLFRGSITATPPGGTISTIPIAGVILMPECELHISLGMSSPDGPMFTLIQGKVQGRTFQAFWQNVASGDCGTIKMKKSLVD